MGEIFIRFEKKTNIDNVEKWKGIFSDGSYGIKTSHKNILHFNTILTELVDEHDEPKSNKITKNSRFAFRLERVCNWNTIHKMIELTVEVPEHFRMIAIEEEEVEVEYKDGVQVTISEKDLTKILKSVII